MVSNMNPDVTIRTGTLLEVLQTARNWAVQGTVGYSDKPAIPIEFYGFNKAHKLNEPGWKWSANKVRGVAQARECNTIPVVGTIESPRGAILLVQ